MAFFTFHLLVRLRLEMKFKIETYNFFLILNDNSKYNFKRSALNPFESFKSLIIFSLYYAVLARWEFFILGHWDNGTTNFFVNFFSQLGVSSFE